MFDKALRLSGDVGLRLTPRFLLRLDGWLLVHAPLFWRSRLHWISWWALLMTAGAAGFGLASPQFAESAWSTSQVRHLWGLMQLATLGIAIAWAARQLQLPIGEQRWTAHLKLAGMNAIAAFLLFLPPFAIVLGASNQMATTFASADVQADYELLTRQPFWRCPSQDTASDRAAAKSARFRSALARFGFYTDGSWTTSCAFECGRPLEMAETCLALNLISEPIPGDSDVDSRPLTERLDGLHAGWLLWRDADGPYFDRYGPRSAALLAVLVAVAIALSGQPRYVWGRAFWWARRRRLRSVQHHWRPQWLRRLDERWLLTRPLLWATRAHIFVFNSLVVGSLLSTIALIALFSFGIRNWFYKDPNTSLRLLVLVGVLTSIVWGVTRRAITAPPARAPDWRLMIQSWLAGIVPLLIFTCTIPLRTDVPRQLAAAFLIAAGGSLVISVCLVRDYLGRVRGAWACLHGALAFVGPFAGLIAFNPSRAVTVVLLAVWVLCWFGGVWTHRLPSSYALRAERSGLRAAFLVALAPATSFYLGVAVELALEQLLSIRPNHWHHLLAPAASYVTFVYALAPLRTALVQARYEPARE